MKTDTLFYRLFQADPSLALELAGLAVPEPGRYRFVSQEVKQTAFRLDGVLEPPADRPDAPLIFVEFQAQPDDGFYLRFLSEALLHLKQYPNDRPWLMVVFYPDPAAERRNPKNDPLLALPNLRRVHLNQLPLLGNANPKLWLIALILARESELPAIVRRIQDHRASIPADGVDWLELLETILVYKLPQFTREEIQKMFGYNDIELKQTRFYQQVFSEGRVEGQVEGRMKGRVEGRMEGRMEGEAAMLQRLLERRFGTLPDSARQRIAAADADTLLIWGERVLDANSLEDVWGH